MKITVLHETILDGWINCFTDESGKPQVFNTVEEAQEEINDLIECAKLAGIIGYDHGQFRIEVLI